MADKAPWTVQRKGSALHVRITGPMEDEWERLMDAIQAELEKKKPTAIHLPARLERATKTDRAMLKMLWEALGSHGIPLFSPRN